MTAEWWQTGVLYQIYPRSFADSNGDGVGDLRGVIAHLDHLVWLGVDGIWLSSFFPSPNADWGYDVAEYCDVDPAYGTLADIDELIAEASERGIRILLDLVANHTSDKHRWFRDACSSREARHRDWYVWADPQPDGSPPNNWASGFSDSAWSFQELTGQYVLHNFAPGQPDLNWWNNDVRDAFDEIQRFWYERGVAGFRLDVAHMLVKDAELRDNPPSTDSDGMVAQLLGQRMVYNANRPETHDILQSWRKLADQHDPRRILLGETVVHDVRELVQFYGSGTDELHLALNVPFQEAAFDAAPLRDIIAATERLLPPQAWPLWSGSNHDISRLATRWAGSDPLRIRLALLVLLTLRGTPLLYQGDEIGLPDGPVTESDLRDPVGLRLWPVHPGRDPERTPMHWEAGPGGGFTTPAAHPWLPLGDTAACNVANQRDDPASVLSLTRDLIRLRRASPDLNAGSYRELPSPQGVWAWQRGESTLVVANFSDDGRVMTGPSSRIDLHTTRARDGEHVGPRLEIGPWEGLIMTTETP